MAESIKLVVKSASNKAQTINGITSVVINADSAASDATVIAAAIAQANKATKGSGLNANAFNPIGVPSYFDTVVDIADLTDGPLKDANDAYVFGPEGPVKVEG